MYLKCSYLKMGSHGNALAVFLFRRCRRLRSHAHDFHYSIEKRCGKLGRYVTFNEIHILHSELFKSVNLSCWFWFQTYSLTIICLLNLLSEAFDLMLWQENLLKCESTGHFISWGMKIQFSLIKWHLSKIFHPIIFLRIFCFE